MEKKIPWVVILVQKTLGPYYKHIVTNFPKTSIFHFPSVIAYTFLHHLHIFPRDSHNVCWAFAMYPFGSIPPFDNQLRKRLETQSLELQNHFQGWLRWPIFRKACSLLFLALASFIYVKNRKKIFVVII